MWIRIPYILRRKLGRYAAVVRLYELYRELRLKCVRVVQRSPYTNLYYCCTQKTASQWFRGIFSDPIFKKYTGLNVFPHIQLGLRYAFLSDPLPKRTIGTHLYIDYDTYLNLPKPARYRTFFILRDPRDVVVSWYFSVKYSHTSIEPIPRLRKALAGLSRSEGIKYIIDTLAGWGLFDVQRSWMNITKDRDKIRIYRFEDFARDNRTFLKELFQYLEIIMPESNFSTLYGRHRFETHSGGRKQGKEDRLSHYRKGIPGDWNNHFDDATLAHFTRVTGDLLEVLAYR